MFENFFANLMQLGSESINYNSRFVQFSILYTFYERHFIETLYNIKNLIKFNAIKIQEFMCNGIKYCSKRIQIFITFGYSLPQYFW